MPIPTSPAGLTPEYLTDTLRASGVLRDATVTSAHVDVVPAGTGFAAQSAYVALDYDRAEPGAPSTVFAKLSTADPQVLARLRTLGLYETEVGFYRDLPADGPLRTPRAFTAQYEPESGHSLLLLEDIRHLRFGDNVAGASIDDARAALVSLARHHAHYWNHAVLPTLGWLRSPAHERVYLPALLRTLLTAFEARWAAMLSPATLAAAQTLTAKAEPWFDTHLAGPRTLAHADYRPDNMAFTPEGEVVAFDWQTARFDAGSRDLAYYLAFGLPVEMRRAHEPALLAHYHEALVAAGVREYSLDQVRADYRRSVGSAVLRMITSGAMLDFSSERGRQLARAIFARVGAAAEDHEFAAFVEAL